MRRSATLLARLLAAIAVLGLVAAPAAAQSADASVLRDSETEALLQDLVAPITKAAGLRPTRCRWCWSTTLDHAFTSGGQRIYVNSGLINAADSANQVQGVLAHEMGHIVGGHSISIYEGIGKASKIQLLTMLVGVAAALAGAARGGLRDRRDGPAGRARQLPRFFPAAGIERRCRERRVPLEGGDQRERLDRILPQDRGRGIPLRPRAQRRDGLRQHPSAGPRPHRAARSRFPGRIPRGTGPPTRRSSAGSCGSRPSSTATSPSPPIPCGTIPRI